MSEGGTHSKSAETIFSTENAEEKNEENPAQEVPFTTKCSSQSSSFNQNRQNFSKRDKEPSISDLLRGSADVIYEGGLEDKEEIEYKVLLDEPIDSDVIQQEGDEVEIEVRGVKYKIPYAIECHLCNEMMNLCLRRTRYRGQSREYPAYRCNRKGCQTFRSIRKVFGSCPPDSDGTITVPACNMPIPSPISTVKRHTSQSVHRGEFSEDDNDDFVVQRVHFPKLGKAFDQKTLSVTERVRKANQERATVFSEFADQLRRDIAANKRVRVRKQVTEDNEQQGTLFYISKELTPQEIIELQDAIIKTLISLRKIPPPMTMHDLPVFANCPYSKKELEAGLVNSQNEFWTAFTNSPQPPLPNGFIRRKDDTLIYRDPKPYEVPEILQQNSPRKQADDVVNYHRRKEQQDAKRMERRHVERKYRSWASLKREFDMAETDERPSSKMSKSSYEHSNPERQFQHISFRQLMNKMGDHTTRQLSCRIRESNSEHSNDSFQWIDLDSPDGKSTEELPRELNTDKYPGAERSGGQADDTFGSDSKYKEASSASSMQELMRTISSPGPLRLPISPSLRSFSSTPMNSQTPMFFPDPHFLNNNQLNSPAFYALSPFLPPYQMPPSIDPNLFYHNLGEEHYNCIGASEVVRTENSDASPFTYIHPDSGVPLTDPSAFLTSFIPSPITKLAPINFNEGTIRPRRSSEPSTPTVHNIVNTNDSDVSNDPSASKATDDSEAKEDGVEDDKKDLDSFLKFDPPLSED